MKRIKKVKGIKQVKFFDYLEAGDTSDTRYHEMAFGIFLVDKNASLKTGADIQYYIDTRKLIPIDRSENECLDFPGSDNLNKKTILPQSKIEDARKLAEGFKDKSKVSKFTKAYWTGPTNDGSRFGAADIVGISSKQEYPVSLKFGAGQLKNLSINTIGDTLGISSKSEKDIAQEILKKYKSEWDKLTVEWISFIGKQLPKAAMPFYKKATKGIDTWDALQKRKGDDILDLYPLMDIDVARPNDYKWLVKFLSKVYETVFTKGSSEWTDGIRKETFENTIGAFFKDKEALLKKNCSKLFAAQMSIGETDMWYAAKGGKDIKLVPSQERFDEKIKSLKVTHDLTSSGTGYIIPLKVSSGKKQLLEITIIFRWAQGQMNGPLTTTSNKKEFVDDWTEYFV